MIYKTIKQVSEETGLLASNIRYYESEGLFLPITRNTAGVRMFTDKDIVWISFLKRLKDMGMPIAKMKEYAHLRQKGDFSTIAPRIKMLEEQRVTLEEKIESIKEELSLIDDKIIYYNKLLEEKNE